eukprot:CAMPEP_0184865896 /NCGR_PEP_ID=MMETSP0580-20130426/19588_1 /TAXON_ID=1118495 /ORGANISM="Dactyliosolen fragilissimus" /LENGTH=307 /DNA_ID=CAMNT_0027365275 /DNA_START=65 /DNA_END=984 /DNA_ORIENTATION=-
MIRRISYFSTVLTTSISLENKYIHSASFTTRPTRAFIHPTHIYLPIASSFRGLSSSSNEDVILTSKTIGSSSKESISSKADFRPLKILGVCGGIGSGKSYASSILNSKFDCFHIDVDSLAHEVYAPGSEAISEINAEFGDKGQVVGEDGLVDRKCLGQIVFSNPLHMSKLEEIVWPHVKNLLLQRLREIQQVNCPSMDKNKPSHDKEDPIVVVEAAVLLDADWDREDMFDAIWAIHASPEITTKRLMENRNMKEDEATQRIEAQQSRRGIGNLQDEIRNGSIHAVIQNDWEEGQDNSQSLEGKLGEA